MSWIADVFGILGFFITLGTFISVKMLTKDQDSKYFFRNKYQLLDTLLKSKEFVQNSVNDIAEKSSSIALEMEKGISLIDTIERLSIWKSEERKKIHDFSTYSDLVNKLKTSNGQGNVMLGGSLSGIQDGLNAYVSDFGDIISIISQKN